MSGNLLKMLLLLLSDQSKNKEIEMSQFLDLSFRSYLSCGSDSLPDTEVADGPGQKKAQRKLPPDVSQVLYARGYI